MMWGPPTAKLGPTRQLAARALVRRASLLQNPNLVKTDPVVPPPAPGPVLAVGWMIASGLAIHALAQTLKQTPIARHVTGIDKSG